MRHGTLPVSLSLFAALLVTSCAAPPRAVAPTPADAGVVTADARALRYGATAPDVLKNPQLVNQLHALFGADWNPSATRLYGAPAFFPSFSSIRMVRIGDREYVAIFGCVETACPVYRGLLLIAGDNQLQARLDDGGFSHYYDYGAAAVGGAPSRSQIDGAWRAIETVERK
jgi:hypothetical protein